MCQRPVRLVIPAQIPWTRQGVPVRDDVPKAAFRSCTETSVAKNTGRDMMNAP
jgi:hypothetical protein